MDDVCDAEIARDAYNEYVMGGYKSRPITELWEELDMGYTEKVYRIIGIYDREGNRRADVDHRHKEFYSNLEGCLAQNIREDTYFFTGEKIMRVDVVQDPEGRWINRNFKTSPLEELRELDDGSLEIVTMRSVYRFEPAEIKPPVYQDDADLIELYLCDTNSQFAAGFYYDEEKQPHPLIGSIHLGTFQDSVMVCFAEEPGICTCRFFPKGHTIEFYDTLYGQQDYSRRILIHNTAKIPLAIQFEGFRATWTILPGESKMITPFCADGADPGSTEPRKQDN